MGAPPSFIGWTPAELADLFTALKAESMRRAGVGAVQTGSSSAQSFTAMKLSNDDLKNWMDAVAAVLGYEQPVIQVRPNFAGTAWTRPNSC